MHKHAGIFQGAAKIWCPWSCSAASFCILSGRGGDSAESCWRSCLRPSSPLGPVTQPLSFLWKAGWPVRNLYHGSFCCCCFFLNTSSFSDCDSLISQVAIRKFVQHQHWHKHLRVSGSQKSSECCKERPSPSSRHLEIHVITWQTSCLWRRQHVEALCL